MTNDMRTMGVAYGVALAVATLAVMRLEGGDPLWTTFWADVAATVAIFAFSALYRNTSFYDAYWSVAPIAIAAYWWWGWAEPEATTSRQVMVFLLVLAWGARLTWNWARGWDGLHHEDWRYRMLAEKTGIFYWPVSFLGLHMMPTVWVFLGCLPLWPALVSGSRPLGWLDGLAFLVTAGSILLEAAADEQLRAYRREPHTAGDFLQRGLWAWSRHPNYLGEMGFWWGLFLFGLASAPGQLWTGVGALAITLLFVGVTVPMIETRMKERRPTYADWALRSGRLLPRRARS